MLFNVSSFVHFCYLQAAVRSSGELAAIKVIKLESRMHVEPLCQMNFI